MVRAGGKGSEPAKGGGVSSLFGGDMAAPADDVLLSPAAFFESFFFLFFFDGRGDELDGLLPPSPPDFSTGGGWWRMGPLSPSPVGKMVVSDGLHRVFKGLRATTTTAASAAAAVYARKRTKRKMSRPVVRQRKGRGPSCASVRIKSLSNSRLQANRQTRA